MFSYRHSTMSRRCGTLPLCAPTVRVLVLSLPLLFALALLAQRALVSPPRHVCGAACYAPAIHVRHAVWQTFGSDSTRGDFAYRLTVFETELVSVGVGDAAARVLRLLTTVQAWSPHGSPQDSDAIGARYNASTRGHENNITGAANDRTIMQVCNRIAHECGQIV